VTPAQLALRRAEVQLTARLEKLEARLRDDDAAAWGAYCAAAAALAALAPVLVPGADGRLLTTREMADRLGVSTRTLLRQRKSGKMAALQLGDRGRAALRWAGRS
jgi:excisionase family DNA binding protein